MRNPVSRGAIALAAAGLFMAVTGARALDDAKYADIRGAWERPGAAQWDPTKPGGLRQQAPLTPEYQAVFEANLADAAAGGQGYNPQVILPAVRHAAGDDRLRAARDHGHARTSPISASINLGENRRIYTDGRGWPEQITPSFEGYSIGRWVGSRAPTAATARSRWRPAASRGRARWTPAGCRCIPTTGPSSRSASSSTRPIAIVLHDQITTIDHAYSRPWTVTRGLQSRGQPHWVETNCDAENHYLMLGKETYFISVDGYLMPTKKNQPAPALGKFEPSRP